MLTVIFHLLRFLVLPFDLTNILMRRKYVEAPYAFHIIYGLCITFILALFEGQITFILALYC